MNYQDAIDYLNSFIDYEKELNKVSPRFFRLERIQRLLIAIGEPHKDLQFVHVAGTKGKGSTCALLANVLENAGYRVGLFTSPHIRDIRERIRVCEKGKQETERDDIFPDMIAKKELADTVSAIREAADRYRNDDTLGNLTFFEVLTAAALYYFNESQCDIVILETGLGGRLDATNSVRTLVCAITTISMEHQHILGDSLDKIAYEKAAIIKNNDQKVVLAAQQPEAMDVLIKRCNEYNIKPMIVGDDIRHTLNEQRLDSMLVNFTTPQAEYKDLAVGLVGRHQLENAAVAIGIIEYLMENGFPVSSEGIYQGFEQVQWPGRFEVVQKKPVIVLDGAHNRQSAEFCADTIKEIFPGKRVITVLGVTQGKDVQGMCEALNGISDVVFLTESRHPRSHSFSDKEIRKYFPDKECLLTDNIEDALKAARQQQGKDDILLICGSIYLISEAREICTSTKV